MSQTDKYCTKTSYIRHNAAAAPGVKVCAIDIGYSGVKCYTDNCRACFPSMAIPSKEVEFAGEANQTDILYRDEKGMWAVGSLAVKGMSIRDTNESEKTLYSRNRYDSELFKIIYRVGMALCLMEEPDIGSGGDRPIVLQTGLPPGYLKSDKRDILRVLSGLHLFEIKVGNNEWKEIFFELKPEQVKVMAQPLGSLYSAAFDNNCRLIPGAKQYFTSSLLVLDPGFGTCDTYAVRNRTIDSSESFDNLGMRAVYKLLSDKIYQMYGEDIPVHAIPKILLAGEVAVLDKATICTTTHPIREMLAECSEEICRRAIQKIQSTYDYLREYRFLLITGGTGEAWMDRIRQHFSGIQGLTILKGNQNDAGLPQIFSNVRGYYFYQVGDQRKQAMNK